MNYFYLKNTVEPEWAVCSLTRPREANWKQACDDVAAPSDDESHIPASAAYLCDGKLCGNGGEGCK